MGWGLRDKSSYKQKSISETTGHDPLKESWESCKGIPGTLALPSQSSPLLSHYGEGRLGKGRPQVWVCSEVQVLLMASLGTPTSTFPSSWSIKHLPSENGTVCVSNTPRPFRTVACSTLPPAAGLTCVSSSKCSLQGNLPCPAGRLGSSAAPTDHTPVSTFTRHGNDLVRCLPLTPHLTL